MSRSSRFSRGQLARQTGINSETIRYYEKIGLLSEPPRTSGGHRIYDTTHLKSLEFIKRARGLGFAPKDVHLFLELNDQAAVPCEKAKGIAATHLQQVREKIADLRQIEDLLGEAISRCNAEAEADCAIIELLEGNSPLQ